MAPCSRSPTVSIHHPQEGTANDDQLPPDEAVLKDHRLDLDDTEIMPIIRMLVGDSVDRRGNVTTLAVTIEGRTIDFGYTMN
jgi:hypothetical protein